METISDRGNEGHTGNGSGHHRGPRLKAPSRWALVGRIAAVTGAVAFVLYWVVVLFVLPAAREDKLASSQFPQAAQPVCARTLDDLRDANLLNQTAATPQARADLVQRTDSRLATMVQQLRTLVPPSGRDHDAVSAWLDDWDQWLRDRATWVDKLRAGQDASFDEKARDNGEPFSKALNAFAVTNEMGACATPFGV